MNKCSLLFLFLEVLVSSYFAFGQNLSSQVFELGKNFIENECRVPFSSAEIIFFNENRFVIINGISNDVDTTFAVGDYKVKGTVLTLTFTKTGLKLLTDAPIRTRKPAPKFDPMNFEITYCGGNILLKSKVRIYAYGVRDVRGENSAIRSIKQDTIFRRVLHELTKK